jgi:hypothetical protein
MMSKKTYLTITFLTITATAVIWELAAVVNPHDNLEPWTSLIADHVSPAITGAAIALLLSWLPGHFVQAYAQRGKTMTIPATPPADSPSEPLLSVGTVTAVATAAIAVAVAFGLKLSEGQTATIIGVVAALAPLVVAWLGRRKVFSPATVNAMVTEAAKTGKVTS